MKKKDFLLLQYRSPNALNGTEMDKKKICRQYIGDTDHEQIVIETKFIASVHEEKKPFKCDF